MKKDTSKFMDKIYKEAKLRYKRGAENHKDKPFNFNFDTYDEIIEELLDCANYCFMQIARIRKISKCKKNQIK